MKNYNLFLMVFFVFLLSMSLVNAESINDTVIINIDDNNQLKQVDNDSYCSSEPSSIYVDDMYGDDINEGKSSLSPVKSFGKALEIANDNDTVYLADGVYSGLENTKLSIDKSINIVGAANTTFDANYESYIFLIKDGFTVTFKNINFFNGFKTEADIDLIDDYEIDGIYGAALNIKDSTVTLDNCYFKDNMANYGADESQFAYGGAISNFGDLTILNSYFYGNAVGATTDILGYGGAVYNKGKIFVNNSTFVNSRGSTYSFGGTIYNDGEFLMNNSIIAYSYCWEESKGGAIFNNGKFILLNSIIENNTIERTDYNYIYGTVFNSGSLIATGNIFRNNTGFYKQPNSEYVGSGTIYNVGNLDLSYNCFINNIGFNTGVVEDIYLNGGTNIQINDNWWGSNENPYESNYINQYKAATWVVFKLDPEYSSLKINEDIDIIASWKLSNGSNIKNNLPVFDVIIYTIVNGINISFKYLSNETIKFNFNNTENYGVYEVIAVIDSFSTSSLMDVGKAKSYISFNVTEEIYYNQTVLLNISLFDDDNNPITDNVSIILDNKQYCVPINEGKGNITFNGLIPGNYTLKLIYNGTDIYSKSVNETEIIVKKIPISIEIDEIGDIKTSDNVNLTVKLYGNVEGIAYLYINGEYKQRIYLNNGLSSFNLNNFEEGQFNITIIFPEDSIHESSNASILVNVGKSSVSFNISCEDIISGDDAIIIVEVSPENFNSEVIISINGVNNTVFLKDRINNITISGLTNGTYNVDLIFEGNSRFFKNNASASFNVLRGKSALNVTVEKNNLTGIITVKTVPNKCSGLVTLFINQRQYSGNLTKGVVRFNVEFDNGTNYIYAYYSGDVFYDGSSWNTTVGEPENISIAAADVLSYEYNDFNYTVILFEENGFAVPNKNISIEFLGNIYNLTTNNRGIANLKLNLKAGNYTIKSTFENKTISSNIIVKEIAFDLNARNITYLENEIIKIVFNGNIKGKIKIKLSNNLENVLDIDGNETVWNISGLSADSYLVEALYFNDYINSSSFNCTFSVYKANVTLNVTFGNMELGKTGVVSVILPETASGELIFNVDGNSYSKAIESNIVSLNLDNLPPGNHNLSVLYSGDNNFNNASFNTTFSIKSCVSDISLDINNSCYGNDLKIVAKLNESATGTVEFNVGGIRGSAVISDGLAVWTFGGLDVGEYEVTAYYNGDDKFLNSTNKTSFAVSKSDSSIILYVKEVCLDENIRIYASLSPNATGNVSFEMLEYYSPRTKSVINSQSSWYISPLKFGQYTVKANYSGDKNYNPSNTTFILNVTQSKSILDVEVDDVYVSNRVVFNIKLISDKGVAINGNITLKVNSKTYNLKLSNGKTTFVLGKLPIGSYDYSALFEGNEEYAKSSDDGSFSVLDSLIKTELLSTNITKYVGGNEKLLISLVNSNGRGISGYTIHVSLNNKNYSLVTDENGDVSLDINLNIGSYNAFVKFDGADSYEGSQTNASIIVLSTIEATDLVKLYGTGGQYFAIFTDCEGNALGNTNVTFSIGSKTYTFKTAPNGIARLNINLKPGIYTIIAKNPVSEQEVKNIINIYANIMGNKDVTKFFGGSQSYKVRIYDNNGKVVGAGKTVVFKVNGKSYKIKTDKKGYATCKINLKPNTYTITATYNGYKVSNKIKVKPVLTGKVIIKKKSKYIKFKAKLINTKGKALKGKKITFKIKGKTYKVKTNKKGFATLKLKLKLKSGKTYKIIYKYGKSKVVNKIKVK